MSLTPLTFPVKVLAAPLSSTGDRLVMPDIKHWDGKDLTSAELGTVLYATIQNFAKNKLEIVDIDPSTLNVATTTGLLITKRGLSFTGGLVASEVTPLDWTANESYVLLGSNPPQIYTDLVDLNEAQTITGLKTFSGAGVNPTQDVYSPATDAKEFVPKGQLDAAVLGVINANKLVVAGTAGETVAAGQLVYFDTTDKEWKLCDADTAATVENVDLGIAQGAGTDGVVISGGVLVSGLDQNQTGLTIGSVYYASNTAGGISATAGTVEVTVGIAKSSTELYFSPRFNQQLTEDQQDALAGTSGTPSATNKFVTNDDTTTTASAGKVIRGKAVTGKLDESVCQMTDAQATDLTDGGTTTLHFHESPNSYFAWPALTTIYGPSASNIANMRSAMTADRLTLFVLVNFVYNSGGGGCNLYRFTRSSASGTFCFANQVTPTVRAQNTCGLVVGESYVWVVGRNAGDTNIVINRYTHALAGATAMTMSGTAGGYISCASGNDGVIYAHEDGADATVFVYAISGTTATRGSDITLAAVPTTNTYASYFDGTDILTVDGNISTKPIIRYSLSGVEQASTAVRMPCDTVTAPTVSQRVLIGLCAGMSSSQLTLIGNEVVYSSGGVAIYRLFTCQIDKP